MALLSAAQRPESAPGSPRWCSGTGHFQIPRCSSWCSEKARKSFYIDILRSELSLPQISSQTIKVIAGRQNFDF